MNGDFSLEVIRRVYDDNEGVYVQVGPDADGFDLVEIRTEGESKMHYGDVRFALNPKQARLLAVALTACADELEKAEGETE